MCALSQICFDFESKRSNNFHAKDVYEVALEGIQEHSSTVGESSETGVMRGANGADENGAVQRDTEIEGQERLDRIVREIA